MLRILLPADSTIEVHRVCHYNLERYGDEGRWQAVVYQYERVR